MEDFFNNLLTPRTYVGALSCAMALVFLMKAWLNRSLRLLSLPIIFFVFGALWLLPLGGFADGMGPHPSPLCTVTKPFLFVKAGFTIPIVFFATFAAIAVMSLAGNKLFCLHRQALIHSRACRFATPAWKARATGFLLLMHGRKCSTHRVRKCCDASPTMPRAPVSTS